MYLGCRYENRGRDKIVEKKPPEKKMTPTELFSLATNQKSVRIVRLLYRENKNEIRYCCGKEAIDAVGEDDATEKMDTSNNPDHNYASIRTS